MAVSKSRSQIMPLAIASTLVLATQLGVSIAHAEVIDFEDVPAPFDDGYGIFVGPVNDGYRGFEWFTNWNGGFTIPVLSAAVYRNQVTLASGYQTAIASGTQAMFIPADYQQGFCVAKLSRSGPWDLNALSIAGAWRSGLEVEFQGLRGNEIAFSYTTTVGAPGVMNNFALNFTGIDQFVIISSGGSPAYPGGDNAALIIDNIGYTVPAPGALALFALACGCGRRARGGRRRG
jgi:hypothetical protein